MQLPNPVLMLVTEPHPRLAEVVVEAVAGGVNVVQFRYRGPKPIAAETTEQLARDATRGQAVMLANGCTLDCEDACAWDGWHLPEQPTANDYAAVRYAMGSERLVGRSVHSVESAIRFEGEGANYLVAGTIFASKSHLGAEPAGLGFLEAVCGAVDIPVIAIGGVTTDNAGDCIRAGAAGVAVLSPIMRASDPRQVAARYWEVIAR